MTFAACYHLTGRSEAVANSMATGIKACGDRAELRKGWAGETDADVAVAYGWRNVETFEAYREAGKPFVYIDLGYWHRRPRGAVFRGYHKVVVNGRDALTYFRRGSPADRLRRAKVTVKPWRETGDHILLAGMSAKSARHYGLGPQQWESTAVRRLRRLSDRPIVYRPKPSWTGAWPISGAAMDDAKRPLGEALEGAWAVVTHHSNVGIDALAAGIPVHSVLGLASTMSFDLDAIEAPPLPADREGFLADVAYCQWNANEMESGACWRHLRGQGLIE